MDLTGAADLHVHFGPDPYRPRSITAREAVLDAKARGCLAIVLKSHEQPTPHLAALLRELEPDVHVLGGVTCDHFTGGLNPAAVDVALRLGARLVWMPTLSSSQDWDAFGRSIGAPEGGISLLRGGQLVSEVRAIVDLVAEAGAVLATGHTVFDDQLALARAVPVGVPLLITHPFHDLAGPRFTLGMLEELVGLGAVAEFCAETWLAARDPDRKLETIVAAIRALGAERCTLASDLGQAARPRPCDGLSLFADRLVEAGVPAADVRRMLTTNPTSILGLAGTETATRPA